MRTPYALFLVVSACIALSSLYRAASRSVSGSLATIQVVIESPDVTQCNIIHVVAMDRASFVLNKTSGPSGSYLIRTWL